MNWSKRAYLITLNSYSLADWLIDIGGISRAIYIGGLVAAHFIALRMYKAALIQDIFMVYTYASLCKYIICRTSLYF